MRTMLDQTVILGLGRPLSDAKAFALEKALFDAADKVLGNNLKAIEVVHKYKRCPMCKPERKRRKCG